MDLFILRHGEAEPRTIGRIDAERALTGHGREEIKDMAGWARTAGLSFDLIVTSPLKRAQETAAIIAAGDHGQKVEVWPSLEPEGDPGTLLEDIGTLIPHDAASLLIVGHEPLLSTVISQVIAGDGRARIRLAKGGMTRIKNVTISPEPTGDLHWLITPKLVRSFK